MKLKTAAWRFSSFLCGFLAVLSFSAVPIAKGSLTNKVLSGNYPPILQKKGIGISYIPTPFFLCLDEYLPTQNCLHPMANEFLMNFVVARCRKVELFKVSARRKAQKFIAIGLMSSAFFGYLPLTPLPFQKL